jgi:hypothetical protein
MDQMIKCKQHREAMKPHLEGNTMVSSPKDRDYSVIIRYEVKSV